MSAYIPAGACLMIVLLLGMGHLYHWAHHGAADNDAILRAKAFYLNPSAFAWRLVAILGCWVIFPRLIRRNSVAQDRDGAVRWTHDNVAVSAAFLAVFAISFTVASVDWIMSLEPHWYSTIFAWYLFSGLFVGGLAAIALLLILLKRRGEFQELRPGHLHDLGRLIFAFSVFWAYMWFSQFLLIWYSNIPEETIYFAVRYRGGWGSLFWVNLAVNLLLPFGLLLRAGDKRTEGRLLAACGIILAGRWLDLFVMIMPSVMPGGPRVSWPEATVFLGVGSLFLILFERALRSASLVPQKDPYLSESLGHHT
ncbi:MAG: hypothetical protein HY928_00650 [Elusimicrobia bacterium]|nr:hypothetical protein [Elusimicrobiota bacterium]